MDMGCRSSYMMVMASTNQPDLRSLIANLLPAPEGDDPLGSVMREAMRPFVRDAFRQGLVVGLALGRENVFEALLGAEKMIADAFSERPARRAPRAEGGEHRGAIAPLIDLVLEDQPGLRAVEIETKVVELDPSLVAASVGNELRRQEGKRYERRDGKRWFLIGDPEQGSGLAPATVPDPSVGPDEAGTPSSSGPASLAGRVGQAAA
jgi:hypothetical protein